MLVASGTLFGLVALPLFFDGWIGGASGTFQALPQSFIVEGHLIAAPSGSFGDAPVGSFANGVLVPAVTTRLRNARTHKLVGHPIRTDLSGRFKFVKVRSALYQICWKARGFASGCGKPFSVGKGNLYLGAVRISVNKAQGVKTFFGQVTFADKSLPRTYEPLAHVNAFAVVRAATFFRNPKFRGSKAVSVTLAYVNNAGDYILPAVTLGAGLQLSASIEGASSAHRSFTPTTVSAGPARRIDLTLRNVPPTIQGIVATAPGGTHWTAAAGDTVHLEVRARDGDPLRYRWNFPDGSTTLVSGSNGATNFHVSGPGLHEFEVVASDGKGGYARESIKISTSGVRFAGVVGATDLAVVAGAQVEISGHTVVTDSTGRFAIYVPERARYVLNIRKKGYGLVSRIYDNGLTGGRWVLTRASVDTVDPTQPIDVSNQRRPEDCPGSLSDQAERKGRSHECSPGIRIQIPPDALVDANGNKPTGHVDIALTTVDLNMPDAMPGDFTSIDSGGNQLVMESYGAGTVDITAGSTRYNLAPGETAQVTIPIEPAQLAAATPPPSTMPLLSYDEQRGVWMEEGVATRLGNSYVAMVTHFSELNMDQLKTNQSCVRLDATIMPTSFLLHVSVPTSSGSTFTKTTTISNENQRFHVIYNLPINETVIVRAWDKTDPSNPLVPIEFTATVPATTTPSGVEAINVSTGAPQTPSSPNLPAYPYAACQVTQELVPFRLPQAVRAQFLEGISIAADNITELENQRIGDPPTIRAKAKLYYDAIDPQAKRTTLTDFRTINGFTGTLGTDEARAFYANAADLGFGRDMNCHRSGADVACYVSNYGNRFTDDVQDFKDAVDQSSLVATVGMEYSRVELPCPNGPPCPAGFQQAAGGGGDLQIVKFYVWNKDGNRVEAADLDGFGQRPVPALCMVCHGGHITVGSVTGNRAAPLWDPNNANSANLNAKFIPFDISGFVFAPAPYKGIDLASEEASFKSLNQDFVWNTNPPQAVRDIIVGMYGATPPGGSTSQDTSFVVSGWQGTSPVANQEQTYRNVVGPSCRSCHVSQAPASLDWSTAAKFKNVAGSIDFNVCLLHVMPHSKVTHNRFWLSLAPHQPPILNTFLTTVLGMAASGGCNS
jgi:cytochrome c5